MSAKKQPAPAASAFDAEVDSARTRLEAAMREEPAIDGLAALQKLAPALAGKIASRRLAFALSEEDGETCIAIVHTESDEELGFIFAEGGEFVFESNLDGYFDDFVDDDSESFLEPLYENLRADLPKYEVERRG